MKLDEMTGEIQRWCESTGTYCETIVGTYSKMDAQGNQLCALREDAHVICWKKTIGGFKEKDLGAASAGTVFENLALGRNFVVAMNSNNEVFYRFFTDNTWTQYMSGTTFEQQIDAGSDWFCVYAGGVFPWRTSCFKPSTGEADEMFSYWEPTPHLDDVDHAYSVLPDGYSPNMVTVRQKELGTSNSVDFILPTLPSQITTGGESFCVNGGAVATCYGQLAGQWSPLVWAQDQIVATFRGVDALILMESGVPTIIVP